MKQWRCFIAVGVGATAVAMVVAGAARAAESSDEAAERASIAADRLAAEAKFTAGEKACRERFIVSSCLVDARHERRTGLDSLRARQLVLDERLRRERATRRHDDLAAKAAEDAKHERERSARAASAASGASAVGEAPRRLVDTGDGRKRMTFGARTQEPAEERRAREARSQTAFDERQRDAAAHREAVEERGAKRLQQGKPSPPLPMPGAASAPSSAPR